MSSKHRVYIDKTHPAIAAAFNEASKQVRIASRAAGFGREFMELLYVRSSQINACPTCLSVHVPRARHYGVTQEQLDTLPAWRESPAFSEEEKAALGILEVLTAIDPARGVQEAYDHALQYFSEEQIAVLEWAAIVINSHNRISIASHHPLRDDPYKKREQA